MADILVQKDANNLIPKLGISAAERTAWAVDYTIYDINADGSKGTAVGPTRTRAKTGAVTVDSLGNMKRGPDGSDFSASLALQRAMVGGYPPVGVLARSAVAVPLTGTLSSTIVASATIPGNSMGPNGGLRITAITSETNNVNTKSLIIRINSTIHYQASLASIVGRRVQYEIWNRGATGSQLNFGTSIGTSIGQFTQPFITTSFDSTQDLPFQIITQLTNIADTITLEAWMVELFYGA